MSRFSSGDLVKCITQDEPYHYLKVGAFYRVVNIVDSDQLKGCSVKEVWTEKYIPYNLPLDCFRMAKPIEAIKWGKTLKEKK